ncbi:MAG: DUF6505 family protein, partial [Alphaproteobacteria bacterium]
LARTIHLDQSDQLVFARPAATGEWAVSGGFEFSNWSDSELTGKARQAFANGWMGVGSFGRATFVAVTTVEESEIAEVTQALANHMLEIYGAPSPEVAYVAATHEIEFMQELCEDQDPNTLLAINRELTEAGVKEQFRAIKPQDADIAQVAVHVTED